MNEEKNNSIHQLWEQCCTILRSRLGDGQFNMWFGGNAIIPQAIEGTDFILEYGSGTYIDWFLSSYESMIRDLLEQISGTRYNLVCRERANAEDAGKSATQATANADQTKASGNAASHRTASGSKARSAAAVIPGPSAAQQPLLNRLNRSYTFEEFVVGDNNRFAYNTCAAVAQEPGKRYNPLFLHAASGLGKTHLLQAIARQLCKNNGNIVVEYLTCEEFVNKYVEALTNKQGNSTINAFRKHFRKVDVLLIDDVQFLSGKDAMQEEFFNTFNALYDERKQIVCTSDRLPQEIPDVNKRLLSRFEWGVTVDITRPDLTMREAILNEKQSCYDQKFTGETIHYLASRITSSVRALESALITLRAYISMSGSCTPDAISREQIDQILGARLETEAIAQLSIGKIMEYVAHHYDVRVQEIKGKCRLAEITLPRQVAMYLSRKLTDKSLPAIADGFNKSHPTVMHSIEVIEKKMAECETFRQELSALTQKLAEN